MGFRLEPISVTLNDIERRNCVLALFCVILPNSVVLGANHVKVVEDMPMSPT